MLFQPKDTRLLMIILFHNKIQSISLKICIMTSIKASNSPGLAQT